MKQLFVLLIISAFIFQHQKVHAQNNVGMGTLTPNAKAILDLAATDKGFLAPRMSTQERTAIAPTGTEEGLLVFDTDTKEYFYWDGVQWVAFPGSQTGGNQLITNVVFNAQGNILTIEEGGNTWSTTISVFDADPDPTNELNTDFTFNNSTGILSIVDAGGTLNVNLSSLGGGGDAWNLIGNAGTTTTTNFVGTTDNVGLSFRTNNTERMLLTATGALGIGTNSPAADAKVEITSTNQGVLLPRMTTTERLAITTPSTGLLVYDVTGNILMQYNASRWLEVGSDPIGTIKAWHKDLINTPTLPWGWEECNGQLVADTESPYNGINVPDLNSVFTTEADVPSSAGKFLRGGINSGDIQIDKTNTLNSIELTNSSGNNSTIQYQVPLDGSGTANIRTVRSADGDSKGSYIFRNRGVETHPGYMTVVWIIRTK
jgi:hypothetical protein